jgi:DNA polymerase-3 subunit delta
MGHLSAAALEKRLAAKKEFDRAPVYLLFGPDSRRVNDLATRIKDRLVATMGEDNYFRYVRIGAGSDEAGGADVVAQLNTVSMFGGGKVAMIGPMDAPPKADADALAAYAASPNATSTLILALTTPKDDGKALTTLEKSALAKSVETGGGQIVKFAPPRAADVVKWGGERFATRGIDIDPAALDRLVELSDNDPDRVMGEVEKLIAYVGEAAKVTLDDVDATVGDHKQRKISDLLGAVRGRNIVDATAALENLMAQNVPSQMILKIIVTELMRLWVVVDDRQKKIDADGLARAMGISPYLLKGAVADAARWDTNKVRRALEETMAATLDPMRTGLPAHAALSRLVVRLCV